MHIVLICCLYFEIHIFSLEVSWIALESNHQINFKIVLWLFVNIMKFHSFRKIVIKTSVCSGKYSFQTLGTLQCRWVPDTYQHNFDEFATESKMWCSKIFFIAATTFGNLLNNLTCRNTGSWTLKVERFCVHLV